MHFESTKIPLCIVIHFFPPTREDGRFPQVSRLGFLIIFSGALFFIRKDVISWLLGYPWMLCESCLYFVLIMREVFHSQSGCMQVFLTVLMFQLTHSVNFYRSCRGSLMPKDSDHFWSGLCMPQYIEEYFIFHWEILL